MAASADALSIPLDLEYAPFRMHVPDVVALCPQKEMFRTYTGGYVAVMKNVQASRDCAVVDLKGQAMRLYLARTIRAWRYANHAIAVGAYGTSPEPTAILLLHVTPEALFQ